MCCGANGYSCEIGCEWLGGCEWIVVLLQKKRIQIYYGIEKVGFKIINLKLK